jgi:regulatory protein
MKITRLISKRNKICVLFDEGKSIYLRYDTVLKFGLKKNVDVDEKFLLLLNNEDEKLQIKEISFKLLTRRLHAVSELKRKLMFKKYSSENIDFIINELYERNYLDDKKFAEKYCDEKLKNSKSGLAKIKAELFKKGVEKKIIDDVLGKYYNSDLIFENALLIAKNKLNSTLYNKLDAKKKREKLFRFLISKGYSNEIIIKTLRKLNFEEEPQESFD